MDDLQGLAAHLCGVVKERLRAGRVLVFFTDQPQRCHIGRDMEPPRHVWTFASQPQGGLVRVGAEQGLLAHVLRTGEAVRVDDAYRDARLGNSQVDDRLGVVTAAAVACPLHGPAGELIGVLQVSLGRR